jgi:hypothetical protein
VDLLQQQEHKLKVLLQDELQRREAAWTMFAEQVADERARAATAGLALPPNLSVLVAMLFFFSFFFFFFCLNLVLVFSLSLSLCCCCFECFSCVSHPVCFILASSLLSLFLLLSLLLLALLSLHTHHRAAGSEAALHAALENRLREFSTKAINDYKLKLTAQEQDWVVKFDTERQARLKHIQELEVRALLACLLLLFLLPSVRFP